MGKEPPGFIPKLSSERWWVLGLRGASAPLEQEHLDTQLSPTLNPSLALASSKTFPYPLHPPLADANNAEQLINSFTKLFERLKMFSSLPIQPPTSFSCPWPHVPNSMWTSGWAVLGMTLSAGKGAKCLDHSGEKDKGMQAPGDQPKSQATALLARLDLSGLREEDFWSSVFMTLWWDKIPKG